MTKKRSIRVDGLDDPCVLKMSAPNSNPEEVMIQQERIRNINRLREVLDITPTPEDIFFLCSIIHEKGPGVQSRQAIAQHFHISEDAAILYIQWAEKIPKIKGKTLHQTFADISKISASQIPSLSRRLFLN